MKLEINNNDKLKSYLNGLADNKLQVPSSNGKANLSKIAKGAGICRSSLYDNKNLKKTISSAVKKIGLETPKRYLDEGALLLPPSDLSKIITNREREIKKLQGSLATLQAENTNLRKKVRQLESQHAHIFTTGKRV